MNRLSTFVECLFPTFVKEDHPQLITFFHNYFKYLEIDNNLKEFTVLRILPGDYDPQQNGKIITSVYLDVDSLYVLNNKFAEAEDLLPGLKGSMIKSDRGSIGRVKDVIWSEIDQKYLIELEQSISLNVGDTIAEIDIGSYSLITNLILYRDIDETVNELLSGHEAEYLAGISGDITADVRLLIKKVRSFYRSKGSIESFKFMFQALFDTDVDIQFPKVDILKASDGKYYLPYFIESADESNFFNVTNKTLRGDISGALAEVVKVNINTTNGEPENLEVTVSNGILIDGETLRDINDNTSLIVADTVTQGTGRWLNEDGMLSTDSKRLQDNFFYQDFSYVITSDVPVVAFEELVEQNINPAGLIFFSRFLSSDEVILTINLQVFDSLLVIVQENTINNINLENINEFIIFAEILEHLGSDMTYETFDTNKEEYPWEALFNENQQFDNITLDRFEDEPDKQLDLNPDSDIIITNP